MLITNFDDIIKEAFENAKGIQVKYIATNKRIFLRYILIKKGINGDVYDYYLWLRNERNRILNCNFKVKRRKTPQVQHGFEKMNLIDFYTKYIKTK